MDSQNQGLSEVATSANAPADVPPVSAFDLATHTQAAARALAYAVRNLPPRSERTQQLRKLLAAAQAFDARRAEPSPAPTGPAAVELAELHAATDALARVVAKHRERLIDLYAGIPNVTSDARMLQGASACADIVEAAHAYLRAERIVKEKIVAG